LIYPVFACRATVVAQWLALKNYCCHRTGARRHRRRHQFGIENDEQAVRLQIAGWRFSPSPTGDDFASALQLGFAVVVPPAVEVP
jgi:hypothetical protein